MMRMRFLLQVCLLSGCLVFPPTLAFSQEEEGRIPLYSIKGEGSINLQTDFEEMQETYDVCDELQIQAMRLKDAIRLFQFPFDPTSQVLTPVVWEPLPLKEMPDRLRDAFKENIERYGEFIVSYEKAIIKEPKGDIEYYRVGLESESIFIDNPNSLQDLASTERERQKYTIKQKLNVDITNSLIVQKKYMNFIKMNDGSFQLSGEDSDFFYHKNNLFFIKMPSGVVYSFSSSGVFEICFFQFYDYQDWAKKDFCRMNDQGHVNRETGELEANRRLVCMGDYTRE